MSHSYLTHEISGIGGRVRVVPEDFRVQEVPLYEPLGIGEHTYFEIEKVGTTTFEAVGRLARALRVREGEFGVAGLKDRHAITRQTVSVRGVSPEDVLSVSIPGVRVCWAKKHCNKLRIGHLKGNRFRIRVRDLECADVEESKERSGSILEILSERGVPNYFGEQRFGGRGDNHLIGKDLVFRDHEAVVRRLIGDSTDEAAHPAAIEARRLFEAGEIEAAGRTMPPRFSAERRVLRHLARKAGDFSGAVPAVGKNMLFFYVSAYQSHLFNRCLSKRLFELDQVVEGDLAVKHANGAVFRVTDVEVEQPRCKAFEISPSGPLFGTKMIRPESGLAMEIERSIEVEEDLDPTRFDKVARGVSPKGARRALRFPLTELEVEWDEDGLSLGFFLPRGSYATSVLREIMKAEVPELQEARVEG